MDRTPPQAGPVRIIVIAAGKEQEISAGKDKSLLSWLQAGGIYLPALCGGRGGCGKCRIRVISGHLEPSAVDRSYFSGEAILAGYRLACAAFPQEDLTIALPGADEDGFSILSSFTTGGEIVNTLRVERTRIEKSEVSFARRFMDRGTRELSLIELNRISLLADMTARQAGLSIPPEPYIYWDRGKIVSIREKPRDLFAIAIDIGTTTIALALINLQKGKIAGRLSVVNRQREFGADVITRIQRAGEGDLNLMSLRVRTQISEGAALLCHENGINAEDICKIGIVGNTTMVHLLLNLSCGTLGQSPFTPVTLDPVSCTYREIFEGDISCEVAILPGISTYVGADIVAGILFSEIYKTDAPVLFLDIGTNGEMVLAEPGKMTCIATAAGPAFEGGNIRWGTGSVPGAIFRVRYQDGGFAVSTIGDRAPAGICGSGVVDTVYQGLKNGFILPDGSFNRDLGLTDLILAKTVDGEDIGFYQKDIRELQLAKSAIYSGVEALLHHAGLKYGDIKALHIAGGFGYNLDFESGAGIGLIPKVLAPKVTLKGNSALGGVVKYLLDSDSETALRRILDISEEFNLAADPFFQDAFIENLDFDDPDDGEEIFLSYPRG